MSPSENSYDLLTRAWIPVIGADGKTRRVGLIELMREAAGLRAFAGAPPVRIALLRLALAVFRDALGSDAIEESVWRRWWRAEEVPAEVADYLDRHRGRFDLFDTARPFLQDPALRGDRTAVRSVAELAPHLPTGNNATLLHQTTDLDGANPASFSVADAACWLVSLHAHSRPGMTSTRDATPPGRLSGRAGPLLGRLLAVPDCENLARTLLLNLPRAARDPHDVPGYLAATPVRDGAQARGPVSLLTWTSRHVLLQLDTPDRVSAVKVAADRDVDPLVPRESQASYDPHLLASPAAKVVNGWTLAVATLGRTPLADAAAVNKHLASPAPGSLLPLAAAIAAEHRYVRMSVYGLAVESTAKFVDWTVTNIPCAGREGIAEAVAAAQLAADAAAAAAGALALVEDRAAHPSSTSGSAIREHAAAAVWQYLDAPGRELLNRLSERHATEAEKLRWQRLCAEAARRVIDSMSHPCGHKVAGVRANTRLEQVLASSQRNAR
ncbi:MAG TPA: type I-E CRISPR-associated protein Cse1/CasA [Actinocrinis sp.]|nr:type I-E CRISPR-associated protein Cse1/CasA [Actinocrinis sp.]